MNSTPDGKLKTAAETLCNRLLGMIHAEGFWEGRLSSSALSTATAVSALSLVCQESDLKRIASGVQWLIENQNPDGGWGDTVDSPSNLATTLLALSAQKLANAAAVDHPRSAQALQKAGDFLKQHNAATPQAIADAVQCEYGKDRTFAIPILMNCALAELVPWSVIPGLPFELAVFPHSWFKVLRLHVVSYALPALIAIGLLIANRNPSRNPILRLIRRAVTPFVLKKFRKIQPVHGGFLEATPLTSFVAMGLIPLFGHEQAVAADCLDFLRQSQRSDGSWPIDTNLSVWVTTSAVAALQSAGELSKIDRDRTAQWIAARQYTTPHPYTNAASGGWAWTQLAGGVPDADDTSGAIIALTDLGHPQGIPHGVRWLLDLQNSDGGWPTFCRGWGKLPFDKSSPDITAHVLRAFSVIDQNILPPPRSAIQNGLSYLQNSQESDGSWIPLWFGNQGTPDRTNPVIGTSLVLRALELFDHDGPQAARGVQYLIASQNTDGGWGAANYTASSLEETALAVAALTPWAKGQHINVAIQRGVEYMIKEMSNNLDHPTPIGLYFSHLWYSEKLYPLIWTIEALGRTAKIGID